MVYFFFSNILIFSFIFSDYLDREYSHLDSVLSNYVDSNGLVNYQAIIDSPYNINNYLDFVKQVSPISHPHFFPTKNDRLAYWINTYNALIIKLMIDNPDKNILEISFGHMIWFTKFKVGSKMISLYKIENQILRKIDPRIHFAISCGSTSCPPLGKRIFLGETVEAQLDQKTVNFINDTKNVYFDHDKKTLYLNKIFKWYKKDFGNVVQFIHRYLSGDIDYSLIKNYTIKYNNYNWASNGLNKTNN